jgi:hypothetical protein
LFLCRRGLRGLGWCRLSLCRLASAPLTRLVEAGLLFGRGTRPTPPICTSLRSADPAPLARRRQIGQADDPRLKIAERHFRHQLLDIPQQTFGYRPRRPTRPLPSARA